MVVQTAPDVATAMNHWDRAAWCLAALALAGDPDAAPELATGARGVLRAVHDLPEGIDAPTSPSPQISAQARAGLLVAATAAGGRAVSWDAQSDAALLAQGASSAQGAPAFARFMVPTMGDLSERLARPGARMLDVGTGVAALAIGFAEVFPQLNVLGLDILERPLALARRALAASRVAGRVTVRLQDVADLVDADGFDLAWVPAPFLPPPVLGPALDRVAAAMRADGWLLLAHGRYGDDPLEDALNRLKVASYGGSPINSATARQLLSSRGFDPVADLPTPPGAPALTAGRRPSA
jgi:hypothetical protein